MHFKGNIAQTLQKLLAQEDTDGDKKITIEDQGPKAFDVEIYEGDKAFAKAYTIKGTYHLANFLQELALEKALGKEQANIPLWKIEEPPTYRINRMIKDYFWNDLTRTIDKDGLSKILTDTKSEDTQQRMYVPCTDAVGVRYYEGLKKDFPNLEVVILPEDITPEYVKSINEKPGILALGLDGNTGIPFVVPGGRFNEMYGWDSYFEGVGLLLDNRVDLAKAMIDNFCYQIRHYGKILNANRSYYLTRTQPPFLSSFIVETYEKDPSLGKEWLARVTKTAIKEYETVWMQAPRLTENGLNRYYAQGIGVPPETEVGHFDAHLAAFAKEHNCSVQEWVAQYQSGAYKSQELDTYFTHDRSLRESGHDTSWRLDGVCADLNVVDLNALLYKYEVDFAHLTKEYLDNNFEGYSAENWLKKAQARKERMNTLLWNEEEGQYFDYAFAKKSLRDSRPKEEHSGKAGQTHFQSASNYFPLWAGLCSQEQAVKMKDALLTQLKEKGGIAGTSRAMHEQFGRNSVQRQWDYPNGWAPHQMLLWRGLKNYGFETEAQELIYRWLWMITRNAVDYNGVIPEKYDVVSTTHKVFAEYGNVGTEFDYITTSGFGWMNASYQLGLSLLSKVHRSNLDALIDPDSLFI